MIDGLEAALDKVCSDASTFTDGESIERLYRCLSRMEAAATVATAAFEAGGQWRERGARSVAGWLAARCLEPKGLSGRRAQLGRDLRHLPVVEAAWLDGDIGSAQVALLAKARTAVTADAMARDEALLVDKAGDLRFDRFCRVLAYWSQCADPDGAELSAAEQREGRRLHLSKTLDGTWIGDAVLDPLSGEIVSNELGRIYEELWKADWAEARKRLGADARASDLGRTPAQRRHDALVEMAMRSGTAPADGRRPEPLYSVLVGYETFAGRICETGSGTVVTPGTLAAWLDTAYIERIVFGSPSRVVDVGVTTRFFTGALRRALEVRDRECFEDYCDVPASRCEADHIEPWATGGRTTERNGRMACGCHNRGREKPPKPPPDPLPDPPPQD